MEKNYYGSLCSWFYDIDKPTAPKKELDFYLSFAKKGDKILEPMCGSGRFLIPFLQQGYDIDGFDLSVDMVDRCIKKLKDANIDADITISDFNNYIPTKKYNYIFIAASSLSLLTEKNDVIKAINLMKSCLDENGLIIVSVETNFGKEHINNPNFIFATNDYTPGKSVMYGDIKITTKGRSIYNSEKGVSLSEGVYELYENNVFIRNEYEDFALKLYKKGEFEELLSECELKIEHCYSDYDKAIYEGQKAEEIIYILKK